MVPAWTGFWLGTGTGPVTAYYGLLHTAREESKLRNEVSRELGSSSWAAMRASGIGAYCGATDGDRELYAAGR